MTSGDGGVSNQGRDGKREVVLVSRLRPALRRLNPDLPVEAIEGAVEEVGILNVEFWILNGRGRRPTAPRLNLFHPALGRTEAASPASLALAIHRFSK
jgi:hypothetical protein